jgi:hypothetical protein
VQKLTTCLARMQATDTAGHLFVAVGRAVAGEHVSEFMHLAADGLAIGDSEVRRWCPLRLRTCARCVRLCVCVRVRETGCHVPVCCVPQLNEMTFMFFANCAEVLRNEFVPALETMVPALLSAIVESDGEQCCPHVCAYVCVCVCLCVCVCVCAGGHHMQDGHMYVPQAV